MTVKPSVEEMRRAIQDGMDARAPYQRVADAVAEAVLALLPGRTEAEVKAEARNEFVARIIAADASLEASVRAFKAGWHQADLEGREGERVAHGLRNVIAERIEREG